MKITLEEPNHRSQTLSKTMESSAFHSLLNKDISFSGLAMKTKYKASFYRDLHLMLDTGMELRQAFQLLSEEKQHRKLFETMSFLRDQILEGASFAEAMESSKKFSPYEFQNVRIGEETGNLPQIIDHLSTHFASLIAQRKRLISALSYPVLVLLTSIGAVGFMLQFVVPMFEDVFNRFGGQLPWATQVVVTVSDSVRANLPFIILSLILVAVLIWALKKQDGFRRVSSLVILRTPFFGDIIRYSKLSQFTSAMFLLISSKHPLVQSLRLVRSMTDFYPIEHSLRFADQEIIDGKYLSEVLAQHSVYPAKMIALVKMAEEVNQLDQVFLRLKDQYDDELKYRSEILKNVLEPIMIIGIGLAVGAILVAMYLPLFKLSSGIQ